MEAVGKIDLVDGAIDSRARVCEGVGNGSHGKNSAAFCDEPLVAERCSGVEDGNAADLLGSLDVADRSAASRCSGITASPAPNGGQK